MKSVQSDHWIMSFLKEGGLHDRENTFCKEPARKIDIYIFKKDFPALIIIYR